MVEYKIAAIDPGASGALVFLDYDQDGKVVKFGKYPMPSELKTSGCEVLCSVISVNTDYEYVLEKVHALKGVASGTTFSFGMNYGIVVASLCCAGIGHERVSPRTWQKAVWKDEDKVFQKHKNGKYKLTPKTKQRKVDTKATSLRAAQRLFPYLDLSKSKRATTPNDGVVDALLIGHYKYLQLCG